MAGRKDFHVEEIIANQRDNFAIGVESVFAEHRSGGKVFWLAQFREQKFHGFLLRRHGRWIVIGLAALKLARWVHFSSGAISLSLGK
ncbi:MAG TPA: hypothetical protein VK846_11075 [Candidatus Limnocylindria bacterium]|nr:hypothetical protein [Candidatus Limnocylindria bacterium]